MDTLVPGMRSSHKTLRERLDRAASARPSTDPTRPRDQYPAIDTFLATASRHLGAMTEVVVPAVRSHVPDGPARARELVEETRRCEVALNQVKGKLYGSTYAVQQPWSAIWSEVRREVGTTCRLEGEAVADLAAHSREGDPDWGEQIYHAELRVPTRPHPYLPHQGLSGRVARAVARRVDRFWDTAEGRMMPEPVHHHDRSADGKLVQYLLADPHLPDEEQGA